MSIPTLAALTASKAVMAVKTGIAGMTGMTGMAGFDGKTGNAGIAPALFFADLDPTPTAPPGVEATVQTILSWLMWGGLVANIVGFIAAGISLAISNERGMGNENVKKLGFVCLGGMIVMGASALAKALVH